MIDKIEPCPFCGSNKTKIEYKGKDINYRHVRTITMSVRCNRCHARGGTVSGEVPNYTFGKPDSKKLTTIKDLEKLAIERWNGRISDVN